MKVRKSECITNACELLRFTFARTVIKNIQMEFYETKEFGRRLTPAMYYVCCDI